MLYTTEEIARMYSSPGNQITSYMITHTWIPNGLKYIKGKRNSFLFKQEWIEEYLEEQSQLAVIKNNKSKNNNIFRKNRLSRSCTYKVH